MPFTIEVKNNNAAVARHEYEKQKTSVEGAKRYDEDAKKKQKTTFQGIGMEFWFSRPDPK